MSNFLILGLPRSRTAWLANFMTTQNIFCSHEGLNGCTSLTQYRNKFKKNSGDSNTGLALFDFEILFEGFKRIIIDRDIDEAVKFSIDSYGCDTTSTMLNLKQRLDNLDGLHVHFDDINDRLEEIWNYLTDQQFNESRADMLIDFDVQVCDVHNTDIDALVKLRQNTNDYFPSQA